MAELTPVDGLEGVYVRTPPADLELMTLWTQVGGDDHAANAKFRARLVELCAVDADGKRLVEEGKLADHPMVWAERVAVTAGKVFGAEFSAQAHEIAEGN